MTPSAADRNVFRFIAFRIFFNARFYYPVLAVMFVDYGLTMQQYAILNFAWAGAIVLLEVPSGALADIVGRKRLVVFAAALMVVEMLILCFAPAGQSLLLFSLFLLNRVLSGAAEASASGADEALVYDALAAEDRAGEWPRVLERLMRWQSAAFVVVMIAGGAVFDSALINSALRVMGSSWEVSQGVTMRLPAVLTLMMSAGALAAAVGFREVAPVEEEGVQRAAGAVSSAFAGTWEAAKWIGHARLALILILVAVCCDSVVRLFLTVCSEYYRQITLPEFSFGLIGAGMGLLGMVVPRLARAMVGRFAMMVNFGFIAVLVFSGLYAAGLQVRLYGVLVMIPVGVAMNLTAFMVSHYLNEFAPSRLRATVLSFKGLAMNLAFGGVSLAFAGMLRAAGDGDAFSQALPWLAWVFVGMFALVAVPGIIFTAKNAKNAKDQPATRS